ncbi:hypothetical protein Cgig2_012447 [Carnegiea gigantea]|uniref:phosphopantothenoylcysteine decarboxylase n=1 Tax=Carnegiea gigantea TaxID=171969 RepID=A0A9Q1QKX9_9CARY|nr:hypothetical protein Cgig2_012447 [Carnegiea gigantea]
MLANKCCLGGQIGSGVNDVREKPNELVDEGNGGDGLHQIWGKWSRSVSMILETVSSVSVNQDAPPSPLEYFFLLSCPSPSWSSDNVIAQPEPVTSNVEPSKIEPIHRKPRILLAASGSVAAIKFGHLCKCFCEWAEVRAVATKSALHFIDKVTIPEDAILFTDEDEWSHWGKIGDCVLHIEMRRWADIMIIAPLSANTLGKIAGGLCDNLLTSIVRAWDYSKPVFVAPAMNTFMWNNPFTEKHLMSIDELGMTLIPPVTKRLACGDYGNGAMAEPSLINRTIRLFLEKHPLPDSSNW